MWRIVFCAAALSRASPFEPLPVHREGPWFEGWFTRIVDDHENRSVAVIVASYQAKGSANFSSSWVAALVSHSNGTILTEQVWCFQLPCRNPGEFSSNRG